MIRGERGFTLLEVLVSISIFAVIGLGANQMLRTMIDTHDKTKIKVDTLNSLTRVFASLERDLSQAVPRHIRDEFGDPQPSFLVAQGRYPLELTRTGWNNPIQLPRSDLQRVAYEVNEDGELVRLFWLVLDRAEDSEPIEQVMLSGVDDFRVSLITEEGEQTRIWPDGNFDQILPTAVEVVLDTQASGELRKVFDLVDVLGPIGNQGNGDGGQTGSSGGSNQEGGNSESSPEQNGDAP